MTFPSSTYLGRPTIGYVVADTAAPDTDKVKLYCQVSLLKGIELWKNVTYRIQWYSEGTLIDNAAPFCLPKSGQLENDKSCPGSGRRKEILSVKQLKARPESKSLMIERVCPKLKN